jgi:ABC-type sugar transport system substrate-binding protein
LLPHSAWEKPIFTEEKPNDNASHAAPLLAATALGAVGLTAGIALAELCRRWPRKDTYKVGFAQTESNNPWRIAQTKSMQDEAAKLGYQLVYTDAAGSAAKQVADVNSMIAQGVDLIFLAPREEKPLIPAVMAAKKAGIPVILLDRNVDQSLAKAGEDYVTFIGSDFIDEGKRVAEWLAKNANGKTKIIELEGTTGSSPANDRKKGFDDAITAAGGFTILASQTGDFARDKGRQVAEALLQAHPDADVIYAHNDEMAMGAIAALEAIGKKPGTDVIVLSIDGGKEAVQAVVDGKINAVVECNPRFGPKAFETMAKYAAWREDRGLGQERSTSSTIRPTRQPNCRTPTNLPSGNRPGHMFPPWPAFFLGRHCNCLAALASEHNGLRGRIGLLLLSMKGIDKSFSGVKVLTSASLEMERQARSWRWSARTAPANRP